MNTLAKDPVCGMEVDPSRNPVTYRGIRYAFCSDHCRQRFLANPRLYVGEPGWKAPRQAGVEIIKKRRLRFAEPLSTRDAELVAETLAGMHGVKNVTVEREGAEILYDLLGATAEQIEERMAEMGVHLGAGWSERLRRAFVHYEEETQLDSLVANEKSCCDVRKV